MTEMTFNEFKAKVEAFREDVYCDLKLYGIEIGVIHKEPKSGPDASWYISIKEHSWIKIDVHDRHVSIGEREISIKPTKQNQLMRLVYEYVMQDKLHLPKIEISYYGNSASVDDDGIINIYPNYIQAPESTFGDLEIIRNRIGLKGLSIKVIEDN